MQKRSIKPPSQKRTERGTALLESAFVLTAVVLPLMFGILDFSRAMYTYHFVAYAAREGSRWASVRGADCLSPMTPCNITTSAPIQTFVQGIVPPGMYVTSCGGTSGGSFCAVASWSGLEADNATDCTSGGTFPTNTPGCVVQVQVTYYYGFSLPFLSQIPAVKMVSTSQATITQ